MRGAARLVASLACAGMLAVPAAPSVAQPAGPIEVRDARSAQYDAGTATWLLEGRPVRVRRGDFEIAAARILYREKERLAIAQDGVRARHKGQTVTADRARADMVQQAVALEGNVVLEYQTAEGLAVLRAPAADADLRVGRVLARGGVHATWGRVELRCESAAADLRAQTVTATGGPVAIVEGVRVEADRMQADLVPQVLYGTGGVRVADPRLVATAHELEIGWGERVAMLRGDVVARHGPDVLRAAAVRYEFATGRMVATGRPRVVVHP
ncbi:MAG: hypothetical protein QN163_02805 [Armatimonadota bacterium]|nr:hypothetical protein [Armatimonadota bacterium]MDR5697521.1 hypothetical protein [Armatimonadota bacterium]